MKRIVFISICFLASSSAFAQQDEYTNGYTRSNGTYVQGYHHTEADHNAYDNYSTRGNTNPYTGQAGTVNPDSVREQPRYNNYNNNGAYR